jgi:hypothetical protein
MARNPASSDEGPGPFDTDPPGPHSQVETGDPEFERARRLREIDHAHERHMRWIDQESLLQRDSLQFTKEFGLFTLRACFILNGGAILSLFAFIGNVYSRSGESGLKLQDFKLPLCLFAAGILASVFSSICGYFNYLESQKRQMERSSYAHFGSTTRMEAPHPIGSMPVIVATRMLAAALTLLSLALFITGVIAVTLAFPG